MTIQAPPAGRTAGGRALAAALSQFDAAATHLSLEPELRDVLGGCHREYTVRFPAKLDDGFHGSRASLRTAFPRHQGVRGPR